MKQGGYLIRRKVTILEYRRGLAFARPDNRVHTDWQWPISGVHSILTEKTALAGEGRGVHRARPLPFTLFNITYKVAVYAPAERADTLPLFHLYPVCNLWS